VIHRVKGIGPDLTQRNHYETKIRVDRFDKAMSGLLAVPYSELQKKLEEEKRARLNTKRSGLLRPLPSALLLPV